jgi:hypothetical protein
MRKNILKTVVLFIPLFLGVMMVGQASAAVDLGNLTDYLFVFTNGSTDANWQGATKGFVGDVAVNGVVASERTSGGVPYAGTIYTNDSNLGAWQSIVNQNTVPNVPTTQAYAVYNETARLTGLQNDLTSAFSQINALSATAGYTSVSATSLDGLNTLNGVGETFVINVTSFSPSTVIDITGDANDVFIMRWDTDLSTAGYQGQVKFQSGGGINPLGGLTPGNFIHVAGDIDASGGGGNPSGLQTYLDQIAAIQGGNAVNGGGFFTGYWLTTGDPANGDTSPLSNAIFVGGWYSSTDNFSMTSGTSGAYVNPVPIPAAAWLLGSGLIGLVAIRRRKFRR